MDQRRIMKLCGKTSWFRPAWMKKKSDVQIPQMKISTGRHPDPRELKPGGGGAVGDSSSGNELSPLSVPASMGGRVANKLKEEDMKLGGVMGWMLCVIEKRGRQLRELLQKNLAVGSIVMHVSKQKKNSNAGKLMEQIKPNMLVNRPGVAKRGSGSTYVTPD